MTLLLDAVGLSKSYGAVEALRSVDLSIAPGETVALVGDNGAGKSTLVKILSGAIRPTGGSLCFAGRPTTLASTDIARALGIETVYQDLGLCENLTVTENIFLGRERVRRFGPVALLDKRTMRQMAAAALEGLSINMPHPDAAVTGLSGGQRQAVALARARLWKASLVLLDEPTAALGVQETARAMEAVRSLQAQGVAIVLITHNMPMVLAMSHRVAVLRRGTKVADVPTGALCGDDVVSLITGARPDWFIARAEAVA